MTPVAGDSPAGAVYLAIRWQARALGRNTEELLQLYVMEGFLARLSTSTSRERFVLKGRANARCPSGPRSTPATAPSRRNPFPPTP